MERKWWTLIAVSLAIFMLLLDITVVNVALPDIQRSLHSCFQDLQWVVDAYSLTLAAFLLTAARWRPVRPQAHLHWGLVVFTASSAVCGLSSTPLMLNLARGVQGVGGAMMFATSLALIAQAFHGKRARHRLRDLRRGHGRRGRGRPAGRRHHHVGDRLGVDLLRQRPDRHRRRRPDGDARERVARPRGRAVDWLGLVTFSGSLFLLVFALVRGNDTGWGSTQIVAMLSASVILIVLFLVVELAQERPMLDLALFRRPAFVGANIGRVRDLGLDLLDVPVPDAVHPGRARLQPAAGGPALPADHAAVVLRRARRGPPERARARAAAARGRPGCWSRRACSA